jgi:hypothetical protein
MFKEKYRVYSLVDEASSNIVPSGCDGNLSNLCAKNLDKCVKINSGPTITKEQLTKKQKAVYLSNLASHIAYSYQAC